MAGYTDILIAVGMGLGISAPIILRNNMYEIRYLLSKRKTDRKSETYPSKQDPTNRPNVYYTASNIPFNIEKYGFEWTVADYE